MTATLTTDISAWTGLQKLRELFKGEGVELNLIQSYVGEGGEPRQISGNFFSDWNKKIFYFRPQFKLNLRNSIALVLTSYK